MQVPELGLREQVQVALVQAEVLEEAVVELEQELLLEPPALAVVQVEGWQMAEPEASRSLQLVQAAAHQALVVAFASHLG